MLWSPLIAPALCPQPTKRHAVGSEMFFTPEYSNYSLNLLSGAVRIPTQSFDNMLQDPLSDWRFDGLNTLNQYLEQSFPLSARYLEYFNSFAMLYTIPGLDSDLRPILLTGHLDTVPVNNDTLNQWDHDPFGADFDGEWIHGRGAVDDKNTVVATLEAVEHLLSKGWTPWRTLILAFGFDEEIGGSRGAALLASTLLDRYGNDAFEFIMDEGSGQPEIEGVRIIGPSVTERGSLNTKVSVTSPGGNSALPREHNGIAVISKLITELESNPFKPGIAKHETHPGARLYQCIAENTNSLPAKLEKKFLNLNTKNLETLVNYIFDRTKWMVWTSQAIDIVRGGIKINIQPEVVEMLINYRVSIDSSPESVYQHVLSVSKTMAKAFDYSLFDSNHSIVHAGTQGNITVDIESSIPVAPITPYSGRQWDFLTSVMLHIFEDLVPDDTPLVVAPGIMSGNTDTSHYWKLSENIYRYSPAMLKDSLNKHTVNEKLRFKAHLGSVAFYYQMILNYDGVLSPVMTPLTQQ